jgi:hypothetical protein
VLRGDTTESLRSLLRLRHALRNLYAWTIRRADLDAHVAHIEATHRALGEDLGAFCVFLDALAALP